MKILKQIIFGVIIAITTGCSGSLEAMKKIGQVVMDPNIQVGKDTNQPATLKFTLLADPDINVNMDKQSTPIDVQVVYLTEDSRFQAMYYDQLQENELKDILGKNYLDHQDYTLVPDQYKPLPEIKLNEKNQYLGVIAYYSDPEKAEWKQVIKLNGLGGHYYNVIAHLKRHHVIIKMEQE